MRLFDLDTGRFVATEKECVEALLKTSSKHPWQLYALEKITELYPIPLHVTSVVGNRFSCHAAFVYDTLVNYGCIASTTLSLLFKPQIIIEMGVKAGHTSLLLSKLNPDSEVHGVDITSVIDHTSIPTGYVVLMNRPYNYHLHFMNSWEFEIPDKVGLCFIDADHDEISVWRDSWTAWNNRNVKGDWCIAWDDYHPDNPGVVKSVDKFCKEVGYKLQKAWSWYWIGTKTISEEELNKIEP